MRETADCLESHLRFLCIIEAYIFSLRARISDRFFGKAEVFEGLFYLEKVWQLPCVLLAQLDSLLLAVKKKSVSFLMVNFATNESNFYMEVIRCPSSPLKQIVASWSKRVSTVMKNLMLLKQIKCHILQILEVFENHLSI